MGSFSNTPPRRRAWLTAAIVIALVLSTIVISAPIVWLAWLDPFGARSHPTDDQLIAQWTRHRTELEQVVVMAKQDKDLRRLAPDFTRPDNLDEAGVSADRVASYRELLARSGVQHGILAGDDEVWFLVSTRGLSIAGTAKGFAWCEQPDSDTRIITSDLDREPVPSRGELLMRHIEGHWWLLLDTR